MTRYLPKAGSRLDFFGRGSRGTVIRPSHSKDSEQTVLHRSLLAITLARDADRTCLHASALFAAERLYGGALDSEWFAWSRPSSR